ncbi:MAG: C25 family cysteine peptidase [Bacteroidota bacterium]|nr:C25 family cysteine peptidase [Bacteroidota bacterium]
MIKHFTLIIALIFTFGNIASADEVTKSYSFNNTEISKSREFDMLYFENTRLAGKIGEPALPYRAAKIMLPPGHVVTAVNFIGNNLQTISTNFNAYPMQPSRPISKGKTKAFYKNDKLYKSNQKFPKNPTGKWSTEYMNGYGFLLVTFTPTEYLPKEKTLKYYQNVTIKVTTEPSAKAQHSISNISSSKQITERVKAYADNPEMISSYPAKAAKGDSDYQLLVITGESFTENFEELTNFYLKQGLKSNIKSVEDINLEISGQDLPERIRNYILQEYQNNGIEHVILGGDVEVVPYRGFFCSVQSSSVYEDDNIPADIYYSALDGSWDDDNDGLWGEPDEDDLLPEVAVARMSFSNESELEKMFNKTMNFQANPVIGELRDPLLAGEHLYSDPETVGSDYLELLIGHHEDNGYITDGIPEDFDIHKLYYSEVGNWSGSDLMNEVNSGRSLLFHVGHANSNTVMNLYTSDITNENFSGANGTDHNFTIVYTHGCICGSFDNSDCIAEHMVKIDNFAAAFVGNSRYGWFNEGQTEGPSQHIHREFTDAIFSSDNQRIGAAHMESKAETASWVEAPGQWEEGALRWCFYDCNVLGDAAMRVWTDEPIDISVDHPDTILIIDSSLEIIVQSGLEMLQNYSCTFMQNNEIIGTALTNESGVATIALTGDSELGEAQLIVSGNNISPQTYEIIIATNLGTSSIINNNSTHNNLTLSPNPAKEVLNISFNTDNSSQLSLKIVDTYGHVVMNFENIFTSQNGIMKARMNVSDLSAGVYFVVIRTENSISSKQIIITK